MNTIVSTSLSAFRRAKERGDRPDYFSLKHYECLSELLDHTRINHGNVKVYNRLWKTEKNASRRHHYGEMAIEDRAHAHSILACAEKMPLVHEGDAARRKEVVAICKRTLALKV